MNDQGDWSDTHAWSCTAICGEVCSTCGRKSHLPQILSRSIRQWFSQILSNDFDINVCRNPKFPFEESTAKPTTVHAVFDSVPTFLLFVALCSLYLESRLCWIMVVPTGTLASFWFLYVFSTVSAHRLIWLIFPGLPSWICFVCFPGTFRAGSSGESKIGSDPNSWWYPDIMSWQRTGTPWQSPKQNRQCEQRERDPIEA